MKFFPLILILLLTACLGSQAPAPVTRYGKSAGEGSAGVHNVIEGDTLYSVSERYDIVMRDIVSFNNLRAPFALRVGQRLKLPAPREYRVRDGDTLYAVSRLFEVSLTEISRLNNLRSPYVIAGGQVLRLPSASPDEIVAVSEVSGGRVVAVPSVKPAVAKKAAPAPRSRISAKTPARSSSKFLKPVSGKIVSGYGPKKGGTHNDGINIAAPRGTKVAAAENGVIVYVGSELKGSGNLILVRHADRWMTAYAHLDKTSVTRGQVVKRGQAIGTVGSTGSVSEPQLHFEVRRGTQAINPARYL